MGTTTGNLVITRREGESVLIGADIRVQVVRIRRDQVQILIAAPKSVRILREEIAERE